MDHGVFRLPLDQTPSEHAGDPTIPRLSVVILLFTFFGTVNEKPSGSHDSATIRALKEIDPDLAGLFVYGRRLCGEPDKPGLAYLIAHAGRELTNCLMRELATTGRASELPDNDDEKLRVRIGNALGLSPNHDTVRRGTGICPFPPR